MLQIIGLILVLAAIYAAKAASVLIQHDELMSMSSAFSWMHARKQDEATAVAWSVEQTPEAHVSMGSIRTIRGAHA